MNNTSITDKIIGVISPLVVYIFVNLFVQAGFAAYLSVSQFGAIDGNFYNASENFMENMQQAVSENTLTVTFLAVLVNLPFMFYMYKKQCGILKYKGSRKDWYIPVLIGIFASLGISKFVTLLPVDGILGNYEELSSNIMKANIPLQIITLVIIGPIMEELMFRGVIYNRLKRFNEEKIAMYITALMFGIYHFNLVQGLYTFVLSLLLTYVLEKYNTIIAPMVVHIVANGMAVVTNYSSISDTINSHWYLKILFMIIEMAGLVFVVYKSTKKKLLCE